MKQQILPLGNNTQNHVLNIPTKDGYELWADYIYLYDRDYKRFKIVVRKGFCYDGASVPRFLWSLTGLHPDGLMRDASLVHDVLYVYKGKISVNDCKFADVYRLGEETNIEFTRKQADDLFLLMLKNSGMSKTKRNIAYAGVRSFGWALWRKKRTQE